MTRFIALAWLALFAAAPEARACRLVTPVVVDFAPVTSSVRTMPPVMPEISVSSIRRGSGVDPNNSCGDVAVVTFAIKATRQNRKLLYSFKTVRSSGEGPRINVGPSRGIEYERQLLFTFPWADGAYSNQKPFETIVRVTPYRENGEPGEPVDIIVSHNGR